MGDELRKLVAELLRNVASGLITSEDAMRMLMARERELGGKREYAAAWMLIQHFGDDAYIRAREPEYDASQRRQMVKLAERLLSE